MKKLNKTKLTKFKKIFETKRNEIIFSIKKSDIEIDIEGDEVDIVQGRVINDLREKLSLRNLNTLKKINDALQAIEDGVFGICEECDEPITEKRLEVVLGCTQCIDCAQAAEKLAKQFV